jgi:hypothetical protein
MSLYYLIFLFCLNIEMKLFFTIFLNSVAMLSLSMGVVVVVVVVDDVVVDKDDFVILYHLKSIYCCCCFVNIFI